MRAAVHVRLANSTHLPAIHIRHENVRVRITLRSCRCTARHPSADCRCSSVGLLAHSRRQASYSAGGSTRCSWSVSTCPSSCCTGSCCVVVVVRFVVVVVVVVVVITVSQSVSAGTRSVNSPPLTFAPSTNTRHNAWRTVEGFPTRNPFRLSRSPAGASAFFSTMYRASKGR